MSTPISDGAGTAPPTSGWRGGHTDQAEISHTTAGPLFHSRRSLHWNHQTIQHKTDIPTLTINSTQMCETSMTTNERMQRLEVKATMSFHIQPRVSGGPTSHR